MIKDVNSYRSKKDVRTNLSIQTLSSLGEREDIVIRLSNKGSSVVVMDKNDYIQEAMPMRQLSDTSVYQKLDSDSTPHIVEDIKELADDLLEGNVIDQNIHDYLILDNPRPGRFYTLPKLHKEILPVPGRPVKYHSTKNMSIYHVYRHHHLQPLAKSLPSYIHMIQDSTSTSTDFIKKLSNLGIHVISIHS